MPSRSKKPARPTVTKGACDLADIIVAMTFEDLTMVGASLVDIIDDCGAPRTGLSMAEILNDWAQGKREGV